MITSRVLTLIAWPAIVDPITLDEFNRMNKLFLSGDSSISPEGAPVFNKMPRFLTTCPGF
jgi:hypothetical protein